MSDTRPRISFPVNEHGWVLLFESLGGGKILLRCSKYKDRGRKNDENNQHRMYELEVEGGTKVQSKLYDISNFLK